MLLLLLLQVWTSLTPSLATSPQCWHLSIALTKFPGKQSTMLLLLAAAAAGVEIPHDFPGDFTAVFGMDVRSCIEHYKLALNRCGLCSAALGFRLGFRVQVVVYSLIP
jgi:hypothetical protein